MTKKDQLPTTNNGMAFDVKTMADHQKKIQETKKKSLPDAKFEISEANSDSDEEHKSPSKDEGELMSSSSDEEEEEGIVKTAGQMLDKKSESHSSGSGGSSSSSS